MTITHIFHVNVNCSDLDESKLFYERLGFQSVLRKETLQSVQAPLSIKHNHIWTLAAGSILFILTFGRDNQQRLSTNAILEKDVFLAAYCPRRSCRL